MTTLDSRSPILDDHTRASKTDRSVVTQAPIMTRSGRVVKPNPKYVHYSETQSDAYATNLKKFMLLEDRQNLIKMSIEEEMDNPMGPGVT